MNDAVVLPRVARIRKIYLTDADAARLRSALQSPTVICPNHPEFFTDWMLDKWLGSRFDPLTASWADPEVVNGMGPALRRFWLANNLLAAVRGEGLGEPVEIAPSDGGAGQIDVYLQTLSERIRTAIESARQAGLNRLGAPVRYLNPFLYPAG